MYWRHNIQTKTENCKMSCVKITANTPNATTIQALEDVEAVICRLSTWQQEVLLLTTSQWLLLIPRNICLGDPSGTGSGTVCCRLVPPAAATVCQAVLAGDIFGSYLVLILPWLLWWIIHTVSPPWPPLLRQTPFHPTSRRSHLSPSHDRILSFWQPFICSAQWTCSGMPVRKTDRNQCFLFNSIIISYHDLM